MSHAHPAVVALLVAGAFTAAPAHAIVRRHDRDDAKYLELASGPWSDAVVTVGGAMGTLVGPRWVLTAAHVAREIGPAQRRVTIGNRHVLIDKIYFHPAWKGRAQRNSVDLALLRLSEDVVGVEPLPLYDGSDEVGLRILFVGRGMTGTGETGPTSEDGLLRGAANTVTRVPAPGWITFQFDAPPAGDDLEGISGPGDSGGPALLERDGRRFVMGVSSSNDNGDGGGPCRYGSTEYYASVSFGCDWLRDTMREGLAAPADEWPAVRFLPGDSLPDTPAGRVATAFFETYAIRTTAAWEAFERTWRAARALADRSVENRVAGWPALRQRFGALQPVAFAELSPLAVEVIARRTDGDEWRSFRFDCEENAPRKLIGIGIDLTSAIAPPTPAPEPAPLVWLDLEAGAAGRVVVDREDGQYLGHVSTVLLEDGATILAVYPKGHGGGLQRVRWSDRIAATM